MSLPNVITHPPTKELLAKFNTYNTNLQDIVISLSLAASFFNHQSITYTENGKKLRYKFSVEDSQAAFLMFCPSIGAMKEQFDKRDNAFRKMGLTVQPYIFTVGTELENSHQYVVVIDNIKYKFNEYFDALFCLMKTYFVLRTLYPTYASDTFKLFQILMFEIVTNEDGDLTNIKTALKIIKSS